MGPQATAPGSSSSNYFKQTADPMAGFGSSFCPPGFFKQGSKRQSGPNDNQMKIQQNAENHDPNHEAIYQDGYVLINRASGSQELKLPSSRRDSSVPAGTHSGLCREDLDGLETYRDRQKRQAEGAMQPPKIQ